MKKLPLILISIGLLASCSKNNSEAKESQTSGYVITYCPIGLPCETSVLGFEEFPTYSGDEYLLGRGCFVKDIREQNRLLRKKCEDGIKEATPAHTTVYYHYIKP